VDGLKALDPKRPIREADVTTDIAKWAFLTRRRLRECLLLQISRAGYGD